MLHIPTVFIWLYDYIHETFSIRHKKKWFDSVMIHTQPHTLLEIYTSATRPALIFSTPKCSDVTWSAALKSHCCNTLCVCVCVNARAWRKITVSRSKLDNRALTGISVKNNQLLKKRNVTWFNWTYTLQLGDPSFLSPCGRWSIHWVRFRWHRGLNWQGTRHPREATDVVKGRSIPNVCSRLFDVWSRTKALRKATLKQYCHWSRRKRQLPTKDCSCPHSLRTAQTPCMVKKKQKTAIRFSFTLLLPIWTSEQ